MQLIFNFPHTNMFRRPVRVIVLSLPFLSKQNIYDNPSKDVKTPTPKDPAADLTGWQRLQRIFDTDEFGRISPPLETILQAGYMSMFVGAVYGGFLYSRIAYMDFMQNNLATSFKDHWEAKKQLQHQVTMGFAKGAFRWGWRLTAFTLVYLSVSTSISVYRNKTGIIEHTVGGATAGFLYKFTTGPRAWVVGAGLGAVLGTVGGTVSYAFLKMSGLSMDEIRYWSYSVKSKRSKAFEEGMKKHYEEEIDLEILQMHNKKVGKAGERLDNLDSMEAVKKSEELKGQ